MNAPSRRLSLLLTCLFAAGCGPATEATVGGADETEADWLQDEAPVTWVDQSKVERQSIGNCWVYATTGWAESLNESATGRELNLSQSYMTYWHWFDQIANSRVDSISTGGSYYTGLNIFDRYGLMTQREFIPLEASSEMSTRQEQALNAINASLKSGALATKEARRNRELVRQELDRAWRLDADVIATFDTVFGKGVTKTLERSYTATKPPAGRRSNGTAITVMRPLDIPARTAKAGVFTTGTLADAMGRSQAITRSGPLAWQQVYWPSSATARRTLHKRIQRALNDHQPVVLSWFVDFNALGRDGTFRLETLNGVAGKQGGHMVVMYDYEVENVPGYGTLKAGVNETRPQALQAALSDSASVKFFRIKNSWGSYRPDRWTTAPLPGYHDLYSTYLNGPIMKCATKPDGSTDTTKCTTPTQPAWEVVLPAGY